MADKQTTAIPPGLLPALSALVSKAKEHADGSEEFDFAPACEVADAGIVAEGLAALGINVERKVAFQLWSLISANYQAGWLDGPRDAEEACDAVIGLCQDIADNTDYAGFSEGNSANARQADDG